MNGPDTIKNAIWFERHRPKALDELVLTDTTRELLQSYVDAQDFPHILMHGRQGSGKTSIAQILTQIIPCEVLTLNASGKERGIETMRGMVVDFARSMATKGRLKVIFLDEADGLTADSQAALKNTMETFSSSCRFILTANNIGKIIGPLRSRCTEVPLVQFSKEAAAGLLVTVAASEGVVAEEHEVLSIVQRFYPDVRTMVNNLQRACVGGSFDLSKIVSSGVSASDIIGCIRSGKIGTLRKHIAGMTDFLYLYVSLFNDIGNIFTAGAETESAATTLCEHLYRDTTVPDREINFVTLCVSWSLLLGAAPDLNM